MKKEIAIVGMSGLLPGANNLDDFWDDLLAGRNAIKQVPEKRWSADSFFGDPKVDPNTTNSIWGGFIDNVDQFDAEFFRISPKEAELMDPQQRLLAQTVWHTFEDAGIKPSSLSGNETGVFVGACNNDYSELMDAHLEHIDGYLSTGTFYSILANRISYLFNLHGPSLSVDTACSSSLVAMHMAAQAIESGDCDAAIVAGVNICWTPKRFISFSSAGMLSRDGQCKTFDASANGYVRGEGVASVLLKPLDQAIADGNRIYAVVKGTAVNHGGKTKGLTVTSPQQQARLIRKAFANAQVEPESVSYIEAHGTGTSLGDPIELLGLKIAFADEGEEYATAASPYCAVGSVKTNIGHLEAAAGIAGIIKTALALKHRKIPASLNLVEQNPLLKIEGSPFYINTQTCDWLAPEKASQQRWPRRAGVSSFGFGGAYAHVVLEEFEQQTLADESLAPNQQYLFVFSAKNEDALIRVLNSYQHWLQQHGSEARPDDLAWSLFHYREHMEQRLAIIAGSINELRTMIGAYLAGKYETGVYQGRIRRRRKNQDESDAATLQVTAESVAARWVSGDWHGELPGLSKRSMMSLPLYPFEPASHWFPQSSVQQDQQPSSANTAEPNMLSAENADVTGPESKFKYFDGREEFAADHVIDDRCVMPGAAYLEMVLANLHPKYMVPANAVRLSGVSWLAPLYLDGSQIRADIEYKAKGDGQVCEIRSAQGHTLHMQADVNTVVDSVSGVERRPLDIAAEMQNRIDQQTAYESFKTIGFNYGPEFQAIRQLYYSGESVVAELVLPTSLEKQQHRYRIHPSLVDGAFQSVLALIRQQLDGRSARMMPISLDEVIVHHTLPARCWVLGKWSKPYREGAQLCLFDIDIVDHSGVVLASFKRFAIRLLNVSAVENSSPAPTLKDENIDMNLSVINIAQNLIIELLSDVTKLAAEKLHPDEPFENFGVDSLMINSLNRELEKHFGELSKTLFFEYLTIGELAEYLAQDYAPVLTELNGLPAAQQVAMNPAPVADTSVVRVVADHNTAPQETASSGVDLTLIAQNLITELLADVTKLAAEKLHPDEPFENFGVDSLMINSLNRELEKHFGELSKTLFFEYLTIGELAEYLAQDYAPVLTELNGKSVAQQVAMNPAPVADTNVLRVVADHNTAPQETVSSGVDLTLIAQNLITELLADVTKLAAEKLHPDEPFENFGVDSLMINSLNRELEKHFGELSKTLFFEYLTIGELAEYLAQDYAPVLTGLNGKSVAQQVAMNPAPVADTNVLRVVADHNTAPQETVSSGVDLTLIAQNLITELLADVTKLAAEKLHPDEPFENFGVDSLMINSLNRELEKHFGELSKTLFFEYLTIGELAEYLAQEFADTLMSMSGQQATKTVVEDHMTTSSSAPAAVVNAGDEDDRGGVVEDDYSDDDIAIIGLAGRYPMAENLDAFWNNLQQGLNCITEIPHERWSFGDVFDAEKRVPGRTYSKWGGFLDDVDRFDPLFFKISPREAELLDPQERLFLECAWHTMEDAGYTRDKLGARVGVYAGVMWGQYELYGVGQPVEGQGVPGSSYSSIANRVSYTFNFNGPSIAIDTMCSSSLTAIHLACQSIREGDIDYAFAGGVNVSSHPNKYLQLSQARYMSSEGLCRAFGEGGDGYVPGEGVGIVLLKSLKKAIADNDNIYAVIKASTLNHGGHVSGYTVPNPKAQGSLIKDALQRAHWAPETISYIEAHGSGTPLGDPIEITGLNRAFSEGAATPGSCAIGSVKSNIGHLESAAGIAGLTKVLLQMKHRKLVPSIHTDRLNPDLRLDDTPFYVQTQLSEWNPPRSADGALLPLRAGVSSFGAGGSNAHLLVEAFVTSPVKRHETSPGQWWIVPVSARNESGLRKQVENLAAAFAEVHSRPELTLENFASTLQNGREHQSCRLAFVVDSLDRLSAAMHAYLNGEPADLRWFEVLPEEQDGSASRGRVQDAVDLRSADIGTTRTAAENWARGMDLDWNAAGYSGRSISIPGYAFERRRCWVKPLMPASMEAAPLHPMLDRNQSTFRQQRFYKKLSLNDRVVVDHRIKGQYMLPGAAVIEMAYSAASLSGIQQLGAVQDIAWLNPLTVEDSREVFLSLDDTQDIRFELSSGNDENKVVYARGSIKPGVTARGANIDIEAIEKRCAREISGEQHYAGLASSGFEYGETLRSVKRVKVAGNNELLAQLSVEPAAGGYDHWILNPALIDGALQCISHLLEQAEVPFTCDSVSIFEAPGDTCLVWVKRNSVSGFDLVIAGHDGRVLVAIEGLSSLRLEKDAMHTGLPHLYTPFWDQPDEQQMSEQAAQRLVIFEHVFEDVRLPQASGLTEVIRVRLDHQGELSQQAENLYRVNPAYMQSCAELIKQLAAENRTPDTLVICSKSAMHSNAELVEDALHASLHAVSGLALALINARVKSPVRILFVYPEDIAAIDRGIGASYSAVSGLAATIGAEHPNINVSLLEVSRQIFTDRVRLGEAVLREIGVQRLPGERVRENDRELNVLRMREIENLDVKPVSLRSDGVYIITGGNGGLGRVFATYLAAKNAGTIVLTGRRDIESVDLSALEPYRERIQYRQVDVCDADGLAAMLDDLRAQSGSINGIIHCAGVVRDAYLMRKTPEQIDQVVSPKVLGTINLDRLTAQDELDFFHLFSSVSSRIGNPGQTDYAYANGFMDNFAEWRAGKVRNGQRHGHSCAIGWSLWRDGGMQIDESLEKLLEERFGVRPLETDQGIRAWEAAFGSAEAQLVVVEGDADKIARHIHVSKVALPDVKAAMAVAADKQAAVVKSASPAAAPEHVRAQLKGMLQELMADIFKLQASELKENVSFDDFGMDSVAALNIIEEMEKRFGKLPKTVLYEYPDLASLVTYLMQSHGEKIAAMLTVQAAAEPEVENSFDAVAAYLTGLVAQTTGATVQDIGLHTPVESYGMDSVKILELVSRLERDLGSLPKTLLFEYPTVEKLARYVVEHHAGKLSFLSASPVQGGDQESRVIESIAIESIAIESSGIESSGMEQEIAQPIASDVHSMDEPVAIIGISGRYPGADNLDKFWSNIAGGVDSISEVPEARWNSSNIFSSEQAQADKTYSKWGGFVSEVDCFDPLFFRISPREARKMDPQERLFLQCAWHTLEDANYTRQQLKDSHVGVFVGVMWSEYQLYTHSKKPDDPYPSASFSSIANRVSYSFDFRGPSMAVDTMCSSSLTAIHLACNSLRSGECDYALAGGVNLNLHPNKYLLLSDARFLSSDGRCRAFGEGGDGYVPGEGVGAVLLKPLSKAVQDGDPIYAVIHGSAVNHGGNATGYSVPNPEAQAKVIESALKQSGWKASSIDYIEAHGTGTSLGDPIEIAGLGRALPGIDPLHKKPIGSVKSNIGHLEAAAGIAGLTKIVLQMRHGKIAPSLHAEKTNPYIEFDDSGLFVPGQLMQWEPNNGHGRRAALSSFGAGGSNAHLLIEDYAYGNAVEESQDESMLPVFVYSASDDHSLSQLLRTHRDYLQKTLTADMPGFTLDVYARNLLAGREARESRVAVLASEISELIRKLDALISNNSVVAAGVYRGNGKQAGTDASMLNALLDQQAWERLAEYWVNTESAIANTSIRVTHRVPCMQPVYPFAKERYWIGEVELPKQSYGSSPAKQALHPLIDENRSTLIEQKYRKAFSGNEFYLNDHMVSGHHVMPAAVYIEMARAASAMANPQGILTEITNIDFSDAYIHEEDSAEIDIRLAPDQGLVRFSIENSGSAETKSYCKGSVRYSREAVSVPRSALNIDALKARHEKVSSLNKLYDSLASAGLVYGKTMRCVRDVWSGEKELVADLALTVGSQDASLANMLMHPALVDSAFQLVSMFDKKAVSQYLPFSIAKIYLYGSPGEYCSVVIRKNDKTAANIKYFDIDFYDDAGNLLVSMQECAFRRSKTTVLKPVDDGKNLKDPLLHVDVWEETGFREKVAQGSGSVASGVLLFVYEDEALHGHAKDWLPQNLAAKVVSARLSQQFVKHGDDAYDVPSNDEQAMAALIADVTADGQHISAVITLLKNVSPLESANGEYVRDLGTAFLLGKLVGAREIGRPVKYVHLRVGDGEQHRCHMIAGMSRSMHAENRQAAFSIVGMDRDPGQALPEICTRELQECRSVNEIAYQNGKRYSRFFRAATEIDENPTPPIYDGACVITGGLGGLGYMVATHLAHKANSGHAVKLALLGRSKRGERESRLLEKLQQQGADVIYIETDIVDAQQAAAAVAEIKQRFGKISSIYHCAGITDDKLIRNKHMDDVLRVTSPKINGIAHLDRLTLHEPLQHVVLFSSLSAIVAPPGQADYAAANGFLDAFADARQALVDKGLRNGKTVSIDWPLWKDGGARVTADVEAWMETSLAMSPLSEDRGMTLLFSALHAKASKFAVLANSGEQSVPDLKAS